MFMSDVARSRRSSALILLAFLCFPALAAPHLGKPISPGDWAPWDIDVAPDGKGLPAGSGTPEQGARIYQRDCLACHGEAGEGSSSVKLVGRGPVERSRTVGNYWPYATTLFDYIRRAMPLNQPQSLSADDTYAVTAYLLYLNDIVQAGTTMDAQSLPAVVMPNRDNFNVSQPQ